MNNTWKDPANRELRRKQPYRLPQKMIGDAVLDIVGPGEIDIRKSVNPLVNPRTLIHQNDANQSREDFQRLQADRQTGLGSIIYPQRPLTCYVFNQGNKLLFPLPKRGNNTFLNEYAKLNRNNNPKRIYDTMLKEWQNIRMNELSNLIKRGGHSNTTFEITKTSSRKNQVVSGVNWGKSFITIENIPPLISQIPLETFMNICQNHVWPNIEEIDRIPNILFEAFEGTFFKIPELLYFLLRERIHPQEDLLIQIRPLIIGLNGPTDVFYAPPVTVELHPRFFADDYMSVWLKMSNTIQDLLGRYGNDETNIPFGSIYISKIDIWLTPNHDEERPNLNDMVQSVYSLLPNKLHLKYGRYPPLTNSGLCAAEAFWMIMRGSELESNGLKLPTIQRFFMNWFACLPEDERIQWCSGNIHYFNITMKNSFKDLKWVVIHIEGMIMLRDSEAESAISEHIPQEVIYAEDIDLDLQLYLYRHIEDETKQCHIFLIENYHIFECKDIKSLVNILKKKIPPKWASEPIIPRYMNKEKGKNEKISKKRKDIDGVIELQNIQAYFDIECYNTETGQQIPYLAVLQWEDPMLHTKIFCKTHSDHDIMNDLREFILHEWIEPYIKTCWRKGDDKKRVRYTIWAHNGSGYDWTYLLNDWFLGDAEFIGGSDKPKSIRIHNIYFSDFYLLVSESLDNLAKSWLGISKSEHVPFEKITGETWQQYITEMTPYCIKDVDILRLLVNKFRDSLSQIKIQDGDRIYTAIPKNLITAASLSWYIWEKCFNTFYVYPCPKSIYKFVSDSYFGGVVYNSVKLPPGVNEEGVVGYSYDFNSMYPRAMKEYLPIRYLETITFEQPIDYLDLDAKPANKLRLLLVTEWTVREDIKDWHLAIRLKDGLYYIRNNTIPSYRWEIEIECAAIPKEATFKIGGYILFDAAPIYSSFVDYFYAKKSECKKHGDKVGETLNKKILNTLYGKGAQKQRNCTVFGRLSEIYSTLKVKAGEIQSLKRIYGDWVQVTFSVKEEVWHVGANIPIASFITAYARQMLYKIMSRYPSYYRDTDSIHCPVKLPPELVSDYELGYMKYEYTIAKAYYIAAKVYYILTTEGKEIKKAKGVPSKFLTEDFYISSGKKATSVGPMVQMTRYDNSMVCRNITKVMSSYSNRRKWYDDHTSDMFFNIQEVQEEIKSRSERQKFRTSGIENQRFNMSRVIGPIMCKEYIRPDNNYVTGLLSLDDRERLLLHTKEWLQKIQDKAPHANFSQIFNIFDTIKDNDWDINII